MNTQFVKSLFLSIAVAGILLLAVNIIGELAIQPKIITSTQNEKKTLATRKTKIRPETAALTASETVSTNKVTSLLATSDLEAGKKAFRKCQACHTTEKKGKNRVGPNLWNVVGREKGSMKNYKYSVSMKEKGGSWTFVDLDYFLKNPRAFIKGTRMSIKGFKDPLERANLIAYLRILSDDTKPGK